MLGRSINEEIGIYSEKSEKGLNFISAVIETEDVAFRLQQYEIIIKTSGQFVWKRNKGPNTYILRNEETSTLYIGQTSDLKKHPARQ